MWQCPNCGRRIPFTAPQIDRGAKCVCGQTAKNASPGIANVPRPQPVPHGPGTELTALIDEEGLSKFGDCSGSCQAMARQMDIWGVAGCREQRAMIVAHLQAAADKAGWIAKSYAALAMIREPWFAITDPLGSMVDEAVRRAETNSYLSPKS